jgi:hypothetical protein
MMSLYNWHEVLAAAVYTTIIGVAGSPFILGTPIGRAIWSRFGGTRRLGAAAGIALVLSLLVMFVAFLLSPSPALYLWALSAGVVAAVVAPFAGVLLVIAAVDIVFDAITGRR